MGTAALGALTAVAGVAVAQSDKGKIVADSGQASRIEATKIARTIANRKTIKSAVFAARPPYGHVAARSTKPLTDFPLSGGSYMILSTGSALLADNKDSGPATGRNAGGPAIRGARDVTILRLNIRVPKGRNCLDLRFRFLSEEFPEFVNMEFNDAFVAELDKTTWDTRPVGDPSIETDRNFARDTEGNRISVNAVGDASVNAARAKGTTYDGATRLLRASTRVTPGGHKLYLSLFDQGDREYDSAVFIDGLSFRRSAVCENGAVLDENR
ncbi:MAG TPA: choice-of-anchor L domain-containing protein [Thermoleophilaceae bacterium]|nr:choice-of-anchor L domain-containing protein [Thermoleophilaceae bacterium]